MLEELIDRFGEPPKSVQNLLAIAYLKAKANKCFYTEIKEFEKKIKFTFYYQAKINPANIMQMADKYQGALQFVRDAKTPYFEYDREHNTRSKVTSVLEQVETILEDTKELLLDGGSKEK